MKKMFTFSEHSLDFSEEKFNELLTQSAEIISKWFRQINKEKIYLNPSPGSVEQAFLENLPELPGEPKELLQIIEEKVFENANLNFSPNFYAYITGGGSQVSILAEMLRTALNQNCLKWHNSPITTEMEKIVIRWIATFTGYDPQAGGVLCSGGAMANFLSLSVIRKIKCAEDTSIEGLYACRPMTLYVSAEGHNSLDKAVDSLGLGKKYLRKIPVDEAFRIIPSLLEEQIQKDINEGLLPIAVIGNAGTTNTGAVDDLKALALIAENYKLWFHVDAAYGGPAAALPELKSHFEGLKEADSMIVNPHKWLYVPFEASCVLVKNPDYLRQTFSHLPDYLRFDRGDHSRTDLMEYSLQLSKDFKSLKIWMTLKTYGAQKIRKAISEDIRLTSYFEQLIQQSSDFEMLAPVTLSIACFRFVPPKMSGRDTLLNQLNQSLLSEIEKDGRIFLTGTQLGVKVALRICLINHRRTEQDIHFLLDVLRELGEKKSLEIITDEMW